MTHYYPNLGLLLLALSTPTFAKERVELYTNHTYAYETTKSLYPDNNTHPQLHKLQLQYSSTISPYTSHTGWQDSTRLRTDNLRQSKTSRRTSSRSDRTWGQYATLLESYLSPLLEEHLIDEQQAKDYREHIETLWQSPLDLNHATTEELSSLPFLSDFQIYQLILYRTNQGGRLSSVYDLKALEGWDTRTLQLLLPLVSLSAHSPQIRWQDLLHDGYSYWGLSGKLSQGTNHSDWLGKPIAYSLRYSYRHTRALSLFFGAEQDQGEPWHYSQHRGFDSYNFSAILRDRAILRQAIVGDYRVHWGSGLVAGQHYRLGGLASTCIQTSPRGISAITGIAESNKMRGIALELGQSHWSIALIASYQHVDGKIDSHGYITNLSESGLHRTKREWARRHQVPMMTLGGSLRYEGSHFLYAINHLSYRWQGYILHHAPGASSIHELNNLKRGSNTSLYYEWHTAQGKAKLWGEIARSGLGSWAIVQGLGYRSSSWGEIGISLRNISPTYWAYYGQAQTHYQRPNNEQGLNLLYRIPCLTRSLSLSAYTDLYRSPQNRNRRATTSRGYRWGMELMWHNYPRTLSSSLRLQQSHNYSHNTRSRLRWSLTYTTTPLTLTMGSTIAHQALTPLQKGSPWSYEIDARGLLSTTSGLRCYAQLSYFYALDWSQRLYISEPRARYDYSSIFLYGRGYRLATGLSIPLPLHLRADLKLHYMSSNIAPTERAISVAMTYR